jgi:hypothetical protein
MVAVGFGVFLWWESRQRQDARRELLKKESLLVASFLATVLAVNAYFIWKAGPAHFLWCTVVFVLKYYHKMADVNTFRVFWYNFPGFVPPRNFLSWFVREWVFLHAVVPLVFILFFARYWQVSRKKPMMAWERPMLVAIVGSSLLLSIASAPASIRIASSALPGIILLVWLIDSPRKLVRGFATAIATGVLLVALHAVARRRPIPSWTLVTPQGKLAIRGLRDHEEYTWVQEHTRPSEYFCEAASTDMYFRLDLRNPTPLPFVSNCGFTTEEQVREVIRGVEQHQVRYVLWSPEDLDIVPDWEEPSDYHLGPLQNYIRSHYRLAKIFSGSLPDQIWERSGKIGTKLTRQPPTE